MTWPTHPRNIRAAAFAVQCATGSMARQTGRRTVIADPARRRLEAAFATWVGVEKENFAVTKGQLSVCNTSPGVERGFCGKCGTSLTYVAEERWSGQVSVLAPTLDDPGIAAPTAHVYVEHQLPWVKLDDGLPTHKQF